MIFSICKNNKQKESPPERIKRKENAQRAKKAAKKIFPKEKWVGITLSKIKYKNVDFNLPARIKNIKVTYSRFTKNKDDTRTLIKEIAQAKILADNGAFVYLLPKLMSPFSRNEPFFRSVEVLP